METFLNYIEFLCDLLVIDMPEVQYKKGTKFYNQFGKPVAPFKLRSTAGGVTYHEKRMVRIDLNKFKDLSIVYQVLAHELRHIFQCDVIANEEGFKGEVDPQTVEAWRKNMDDYLNSKDAGHENQPIELDATAFSYVVCMTLLHAPIKFSCDAEKLAPMVYDMTQNYTESEILECAKEFGIQPRRILA